MNTTLTNKTILTKHSNKAKPKLANPQMLIIYLLYLSTGTDTTISKRNTKPGYQETELQNTRVENIILKFTCNFVRLRTHHLGQ